MKVYCIHDRKAGQWYPPFTSYNLDCCKRDVALRYEDYPKLVIPDLDVFEVADFAYNHSSAVNPFVVGENSYKFVFAVSEVVDLSDNE